MEAEQEKRLCEKCGAFVAPEDGLCPRCGYQLERKAGWKRLLILIGIILALVMALKLLSP